MKNFPMITAALISLFCIGCTNGKKEPNGFYTLHVHSVEQSDNRYTATVKLKAIGRVMVVVHEDNGESTVVLNPDEKTNENECEIYFEANWSEKDGKPQIETLAQIRNNRGTKVGGPSTYYPNPKDKKTITDFLEISITPGQYKVDEEIHLGTSHGEPISLLVRQM